MASFITRQQHFSCWQDSIFTSVLWGLGLAISSRAQSKVTNGTHTKAFFQLFSVTATRCASWILPRPHSPYSMVACYFVSLSYNCLWITVTKSPLKKKQQDVMPEEPWCKQQSTCSHTNHCISQVPPTAKSNHNCPSSTSPWNLTHPTKNEKWRILWLHTQLPKGY